MKPVTSLAPILKWVGGKRQLLPEILPKVPATFKNYIEPFFGGGAVFFELLPNRARINDFNTELINVYTTVKEHPDELISLLEQYREQNTKEFFYYLRGLDREETFSSLTSVERAARIIYLNKTCYNGLYRVNASGFFNTPYGRYKNPNIVNESVLRAMSAFFNQNDITITSGDYKETLRHASPGDFVYLDPPYMPISSSSAFTGYTEGGFDYAKQVELKEACDQLRDAGIPFLQSNSDCQEIRSLYKDYKIHTVQAKRNINSKGNLRGQINEVIIHYGGEKRTKRK